MRRRNLFSGWLLLCALAVQAIAGDVFWIANAPGVPQVTKFTITGVWVADDDSTITVNGKPNTVTYGAVSTSTSDVAAAIAAALNSNDTSTTTLDLISDETKNIGGQQITEFRDFTATASSGGLDLITNGVFSADSDWTKNSWTIGSGTANATTVSDDLEQTIVIVEGRSYELVFDLTRSAGSVTAKIGGTSGTSRSTANTFTETIVAGSGSLIEFTGVGFTGTLDNVVLKEGAVVTLTGTTDGRPFTATSSETTAGTGAIADATPTAASGPNHWTTATNWDTGVVPALGDDVYFTQGNIDCLYGLDDSGKDLNSFTREPGYTGKIGLPKLNTDHGKTYFEYRTTHLQIEPETGGDFFRIHGGARTNINTFAEAANVTIESGNVSLITTSGVITLTALGGTVECGNRGEDACVLGTVICGDPSGGAATVNISKSCTGAIDLTVYNGTAVVDVAMGGTETATVYGHLIVESGAQNIINVRKTGKLTYNGPGTLTTLNTYDTAWADFSKDTRAKTITNVNMWKGTRFSDPFGVTTRTNGIDAEDGGLQDVKIETVIGRTWSETGL